MTLSENGSRHTDNPQVWRGGLLVSTCGACKMDGCLPDGVEVDGKDSWVPVSGSHRLELFNRQGERMDQIRFEVRGTHAGTQTNRVHSFTH